MDIKKNINPNNNNNTFHLKTVEMASRKEAHFATLLARGDAEIKSLREEVERLKKENESIKTEGEKRLEREKTILLEKIDTLQRTNGPGESEAILRMQREVALHKETNARLMLKIDELNGKLKKT